jgi:hypothetical protein
MPSYKLNSYFILAQVLKLNTGVRWQNSKMVCQFQAGHSALENKQLPRPPIVFHF